MICRWCYKTEKKNHRDEIKKWWRGEEGKKSSQSCRRSSSRPAALKMWIMKSILYAGDIGQLEVIYSGKNWCKYLFTAVTFSATLTEFGIPRCNAVCITLYFVEKCMTDNNEYTGYVLESKCSIPKWETCHFKFKGCNLVMTRPACRMRGW